MAHELDMNNNQANVAYVGQVPWHGLGQKLKKGASIPIWAKAAGLNWDIKRSGVTYKSDAKKGPYVLTFENKDVLYRSDTKDALSIVSDRYKIVQPKEVLEFYKDLVGAAGFNLHTAGSLAGGRKIWALAEIGKSVRIKGQDKIDGFLLLATSCDGSLATTAKFTSVRVVCNNTLSLANMDGSQPSIRVPHSKAFDANIVKKELGIYKESWKEFEEVVLALSSRKVKQKEAQKWLVETFGDPEKEMGDQPAARIMKEVWNCVTNSPGSDLKSANGTAWGLINGATYFFDHARKTRTNDKRLDRSWFGNGETAKNRALKNALKLVA